MPSKVLAFAVAGLAFAVAASSVVAAPLVTMITSTQTRTQTQGAGTYGVLDFFWTNTAGAEFTNYRIIVNAISGSLFDPARVQDDRQYNSTQESFSSGSIDTYVNTVMSSAAKEDGGYNASLVVNAGSYAPTGLGAAPPFSFLDWSVFDTATGDDNDLNDHPDGGYAVTAPYHIARVLTSVGASGTVEFRAFDTSNPDQPAIYSFIGHVPPPPPDLGDEDLGNVLRGTTVMSTLPFSEDRDLFDWDLVSFNGVGATVDPNTGEFTWDSTGAPLGSYTAVIRASHFEIGEDTGTLTFNLVPEPATITLLGLAMVGFFGLRRRQ